MSRFADSPPFGSTGYCTPLDWLSTVKELGGILGVGRDLLCILSPLAPAKAKRQNHPSCALPKPFFADTDTFCGRGMAKTWRGSKSLPKLPWLTASSTEKRSWLSWMCCRCPTLISGWMACPEQVFFHSFKCIHGKTRSPRFVWGTPPGILPLHGKTCEQTTLWTAGADTVPGSHLQHKVATCDQRCPMPPWEE